jgi:hypothetical protein
MAMSFHLLVRSSGPLRAQDGSPLQRPEQPTKNGEVALRHDKSVQRRIRDARFPVINARLGIPHRSDRY